MVRPKTRTISHIEIKMKNKIFAISAAPASILVKPNIPAMMATIRKMNDHFSIRIYFMFYPMKNLCQINNYVGLVKY